MESYLSELMALQLGYASTISSACSFLLLVNVVVEGGWLDQAAQLARGRLCPSEQRKMDASPWRQGGLSAI